MTSPATAVSIMGTVDLVLRESAVFALSTDNPGTVCLVYDLHADEGRLRRMVIDHTGMIEDESADLEHACLSCALREDVVPSVARLARDDRWSHIVLALPVTAETFVPARALSYATRAGEPLHGIEIATVFTIVDLESLKSDLLTPVSVHAHAGARLGARPQDESSVPPRTTAREH